MLDRARVLQALEQVSDKLFLDVSVEFNVARQLWNALAADPTFVHRTRTQQTPWLMPWWHGPVDAVIPVSRATYPYTILGADGSQIYPDRHQGTSCFLVNVGLTAFHYNDDKTQVWFEGIPYIFTGSDELASDVLDLSTDTVNARRQELEFAVSAQRAVRLQEAAGPGMPLLVLFDGSLIFWHLEAKDASFKTYFVNTYVRALEEFYLKKIPMACYVSLPKNKELVNLIRYAQLLYGTQGQDAPSLDHIVDTHVAGFFLKPYTRSTVFKNFAAITQMYPDHLKPYFFYIASGQEIARVEVPAWIAQDDRQLERVAQMVIDQCIKGHGYPVSLAEAHEQAVVKGADRDFFYHLIQKLGIEHKQRHHYSQKLIKKRGMGI